MLIRRCFIRYCFIVLISLFSFQAFATYTCAGKVKGLTISPQSGQLLAETLATFTWPGICSINTDFNGISPEVCRVIYSTLLTAQTTDKTVTFWFNDNLDCSTNSHPAWHPLTGWYFGPMIK